ncbi:twin-arginine translocase subunit TatC [Vibrio cionasavignyae]|uniref:twin-arginine translocase subunit TatC n=1 Tax=Vibrio cionasavignyae TaxID=2910252 RepID=UPI003D09B96B
MSEKLSILSHLNELKAVLLKAITSVLLVFLILVYFAGDIYEFVSAPLIETLPSGTSMIATQVVSPFFTPLKLTLYVSVFLAVPYLLFVMWRFVALGLYQHEKKAVLPLVMSSSVLFYGGVSFAFFVVLPIAFSFFSSVALEGVNIATDIDSYLSFVLKIFLAFGLAFQMPVATVLVCLTGISSHQDLRKKRAHIIVGAFVIGMMLTPPDMFSQTLLAIPIWLLFEAGLLVARFYEPNCNHIDSTLYTER